MITESTIYWITRLDYFKDFTLYIGITLSILSFIGVIAGFAAWVQEGARRFFFTALSILLITLSLIIGSLFIPTTKEICAIKIIPIIANNEEVKELPDKVVELANEWIEELKPKEGDLK